VHCFTNFNWKIILYSLELYWPSFCLSGLSWNRWPKIEGVDRSKENLGKDLRHSRFDTRLNFTSQRPISMSPIEIYDQAIIPCSFFLEHKNKNFTYPASNQSSVALTPVPPVAPYASSRSLPLPLSRPGLTQIPIVFCTRPHPFSVVSNKFHTIVVDNDRLGSVKMNVRLKSRKSHGCVFTWLNYQIFDYNMTVKLVWTLNTSPNFSK